MKRILNPLTALILTVTLSGCSLFRPAHQTITVRASEPQAQVWINDNFEGEAPVQASVKRNRSVNIMVEKDGFHPGVRTVGRHLSNTAILDIVGTFLILIPGIGLFSPGAWDLDETQVFIQLLPEKQAEAADSETSE